MKLKLQVRGSEAEIEAHYPSRIPYQPDLRKLSYIEVDVWDGEK